jgi:hypothetical protein
MFVLNEIADDYENLHQVAKQVASLSSDCGLTIETHEILEALGDLIANDLASAYRLSSTSTAEKLYGMPPADQIGSPDESMMGDIYFWVTEKGRQLVRSRSPDWPFDDDYILKTNWNRPED